MQHFINRENIGIVFSKQVKAFENYQHIFLSNRLIESSYLSNKTGEITYIAPLYIYSDLADDKSPNFDTQILEKIEKSLGLKLGEGFDELNLFDYIYAQLHSPSYREKFKEFLKIDFPRVPFPADKERFFALAEFGKKLRQIHLLEEPSLESRVIELRGEDLEIKNRLTKKDVKINDDFAEVKLNETTSLVVPKVAWEFFIGGYQPAQKYLKDRVGLKLDRKILKHYNKMVNALMQTSEIMGKIG